MGGKILLMSARKGLSTGKAAVSVMFGMVERNPEE